MNFKSFGKLPVGERLQRIRKSPQYRDGKFYNTVPTEVNPRDVSIFRILKKMLSRPASVRPSLELPHEQTNLRSFQEEDVVVVWFGHSSYFIQVKGFKILVDPVFSGNASPFRFFGKAFEGADYFTPNDFPQLDLLVFTHDHYDHLDWPSVKKLIPKTQRIITSLGVGGHLEFWGVQNKDITELDWWESYSIAGKVKITATPSRHFSGRGVTRAKTLWSSFVLEINDYRFFLGGDSGYDRNFKKIGDEFGPFNLAFLECGQYGKYWPQIHMFPEETLMAGKDLKAEIIFPVHWGKFVLSTHPWNEPIRRFTEAAKREDYCFTAPKIGQPFYLEEALLQDEWWNFEQQK